MLLSQNSQFVRNVNVSFAVIIIFVICVLLLTVYYIDGTSFIPKGWIILTSISTTNSTIGHNESPQSSELNISQSSEQYNGLSQLPLMPLNAKELNKTKCLDHTIKVKGHFGPSHIFVKSKLIVLITAKTGSSFFKSNLLKPLNESLPHNSKIHQIWHDASIDFVQYFCNPKYKKIMVYRDPMERLLSGYLDKCTETNYKYRSKIWHTHCQQYLLSVGIDIIYLRKYKISKQKLMFLNRNNTLKKFIEWIFDTYSQENDTLSFHLDPHFRNFHFFCDLEYFHENWNYFHLNDANSFDYIFKSILNDTNLFKYWYRIKSRNFNAETAQKTSKIYYETGASSKVLRFYNDIETLYLGLRFTWKDYYIFEWNLPPWICNVLRQNNTTNASIKSDVLLFINTKFNDKPQLLPVCILGLT